MPFVKSYKRAHIDQSLFQLNKQYQSSNGAMIVFGDDFIKVTIRLS